MVYTPSALNLVSAMRAETGFADEMRGHHSPLVDRNRPMRSYDVQYLCRDGQTRTARHSAPATPPFQDAFSAFARGTLITTTRGPVAVEDLAPGMKVVTNERGPSPILWIGSMTVRPETYDRSGSDVRLIRVMAEALGMGRPMTDFMAGPGARVLQRTPGLQEQTLRPVRHMLDGTHVIELRPPSTIQFYHIALFRHATITAEGLDTETFHPGPGFDQSMSLEDLNLFISLFPHIRKPVDFGSLAHPRHPLRNRNGDAAA